jgi:alpha-ketoglutarate-dependent taurine dioxygenase
MTTNAEHVFLSPAVRCHDMPAGAESRIPEELRTALLHTVATDGITILRNFPSDPEALLRLGHALGRPEPRYPLRSSPAPDDTLAWVTDVYYRSDTADDEHKPFTHRATELQLHTARAAATAQPRLFMMLMADPGQPGPGQDNGQSLFARVDDATAMLNRLAGTVETDRILTALATTPISTEDPYPDVPVIEPILTRHGERWTLRYWENILVHANATVADQAVVAALHQFDEALRATRIEIKLGKGDVVLLDNHRVTHARRAFPRWTVDEHGNRVPSTRLIYNLHVYVEPQPDGERR